MITLVGRLLRDDRGQDLVEYALLTTVVSLSAVVVFDLMSQAINSTYASWGTSTNDLWESPAPSGS